MPDVMVTARMSPEKKEAANRVFEQLGTNASRAINDLYDYVIEKKELPTEEEVFSESLEGRLREAAVWFGEVSLPMGNRFSTMTDSEIKRERLVSRELVDWGDFS